MMLATLRAFQMGGGVREEEMEMPGAGVSSP